MHSKLVISPFKSGVQKTHFSPVYFMFTEKDTDHAYAEVADNFATSDITRVALV